MEEKVLDQFIERINHCFGTPFLEEGHVEASRDHKGGGFCLRVGNRDIQFDDDLQFVGQGSMMPIP